MDPKALRTLDRSNVIFALGVAREWRCNNSTIRWKSVLRLGVGILRFNHGALTSRALSMAIVQLSTRDPAEARPQPVVVN